MTGAAGACDPAGGSMIRRRLQGGPIPRHRLTRAESRTASFHEAGHGCAAAALDVPFDRIDIISTEDRFGRIHYASDHLALWDSIQYRHNNPRAIQLVERRIIVCLAGAEAQRRFAPYSYWWHSGTNDRGNVEKWLRRLLAGSPNYDDPETAYSPEQLAKLDTVAAHRYRISLYLRAEMLIARLMPQIERVAEALLQRNVLGRADVLRLMKPRPCRAIPNKRN